jgi:hypothetical protein
MSTPAERALTYAMKPLTRMLAPVYVFGGVRFRGLTPEAVTDSGVGPRGLAFGKEHALEITASVCDFRNGLPKSGDTIFHGQNKHRVIGVNCPPGSHLLTIQVTQLQST